MDILEEKTTGDIYNKDHQFNYYTAELYGGLFFTNGSICNESNIVKGIDFSVRSKKRNGSSQGTVENAIL